MQQPNDDELANIDRAADLLYDKCKFCGKHILPTDYYVVTAYKSHLGCFLNQGAKTSYGR